MFPKLFEFQFLDSFPGKSLNLPADYTMALIQQLTSFDWQQESDPSSRDFVAIPLFALFFLSVRYCLDGYVFENVARRLMFGKGHEILDFQTDERRKKIKKFKESAWKFVYFLSAEILALSVTYDEAWFTNTKYFWVGPGNQVWPDQKIKLKLKALYMYAAGFYTYSIFALIFWETRRSDFVVSMSHHLASLILIVLSYILRFYRVGSVVLALHDASDVFLEIGKMSKYRGAEAIASISFILFVLSWVLLRLIFFPFWVIRSTSYEVLLTLDKEKHAVDGPICYYVFNSLLICLLVMHIYWWVLMYRMLVRQIQDRGKLSEDVRSDSEGEDEHED
ncbi:LAG1 longevity assurance homolog 3 [Neltuma alba]|uniref:LAG1 longevity assurance homolog 3 n=1 Tax=Neltuma alba TaxID=207710 RepID=UPI0010A4FBDC|nr:LAG1 longevity assurance homolog 3-like [Prosopis alba]